MNRNEYLRDSSVEAFIDWLRPHVRGDYPFQHEFTLRRPHCNWSCNSIWEAYENYWWRGSFEANQEELDRLTADVRRARDRDDRDGFVKAAYGILHWGGVMASNVETLRALAGAALSTFRETSHLLDPPHADTSRLDGVRYMNAGWTKVYALMLDGFPIYDGRVGAAMGYLVQQYCAKAGLRQVPTLLCFRWGAARGEHNRNPSMGSLRFRGLTAAIPRTWAECNIWAAWILGEVCREGEFGGLVPRRQLRALEAALFMIGYELPGRPRAFGAAASNASC